MLDDAAKPFGAFREEYPVDICRMEVPGKSVSADRCAPGAEAQVHDQDSVDGLYGIGGRVARALAVKGAARGA